MDNSASNLFSKYSNRLWTVAIFLLLLVAGILLYRFVHQATTTISEALAEEVLEQQQDVAELIHEYSDVSMAVTKYQQFKSPEHRDRVEESLQEVSEKLEKMRSQYSFERLDGAAKAHAYVKPVIEDVNEWLLHGFGSYAHDNDFVLDLAAKRLGDRISFIRQIARETDEIANSLIFEQRNEISDFRDSLLALLASFAVLVSLIFMLLIRQRNLQARIGINQYYQNLGKIKEETKGREKAEKALLESANILRKTLDAIPENIAMINSKGAIAATNKQWQKLVSDKSEEYRNGGVGYSFDTVYGELIDKEMRGGKDVLSEIDTAQKHQKELKAKEYLLGSSDDKQWIEVSAIPFVSNEESHTLLIHKNVTERKYLETRDSNLRAEMAHFSRLTSAGELATGLAHELNQPLTAISHNCHAALTSIKSSDRPDSELIETLDDVYNLAQRAGNIIRSMRRFTQKDEDKREATDINYLIKETIRLTHPDAREKGVDIILLLDDEIPEVVVDPIQIQQVLVNLERNSVEAMSTLDSATKRLTIRTELTPKNALCVSVEDNGPGLSSKIQKTLFSTFQTTKKDSMGLGLAISRSIVEAHGGTLWVDENTSEGVVFKFTLPV